MLGPKRDRAYVGSTIPSLDNIDVEVLFCNVLVVLKEPDEVEL